MDTLKYLKVLIFVNILLTFTLFAFSQSQRKENATQNEKANLDPKVVYGKLENGLTYYIHKNVNSKGKADFYLVKNIGSMQEEEHQHGYSYVLSKLALYKTKNFSSEKGVTEIAESLGLKIDKNIEILTNFDETIHKIINVEIKRQSILDSCLMILSDWTSNQLFDDNDIEKVRTNIRNEREKLV